MISGKIHIERENKKTAAHRPRTHRRSGAQIKGNDNGETVKEEGNTQAPRRQQDHRAITQFQPADRIC
jgi:hypothetical protein